MSDIKTFEVTITVRNNQLKERRLSHGVTQKMLAGMMGIHVTTYSELECMRRKPTWTIRSVGKEAWRDVALRIAEFYEVEPQVLFPEALKVIKNPIIAHRLDEEEIEGALETYAMHYMPTPEDTLISSELREKVSFVLATLTPREEDIMRRRFGIGTDEQTQEEVKKDYEISKERIGQIEAKALHKLRHPSRRERLKVFFD